jgi:hypothetical protein
MPQRTWHICAALQLLSVAASAQEALPERLLNRVKAAVVLVRVDQGSQQVIVGTGVLVHKARDQGIIATNHHVIAGIPGQAYSVVFHSGHPDEIVADAFLVGSDPDSDVAFLKVSVNNLPMPAKVNAIAPLRETLPVYAFGFPFGDRLETREGNPAVTVTPATVSSIRLDDDGDVHRIQIAGDVNPGNSGGPLVNGEGELVGLVVAEVRATQIGFAIPAAQIERGLHGYVREVSIDPIPTSAGKAMLNVRASIVDPLSRIRHIKLLLAPVRDDARYSRTEDGRWARLTPTTGEYTLEIAGDVAHAEIELTHKDPGNVRYAYQVVTQGGGRSAGYSRPHEISVEFGSKALEKPPSRKSTPGWLEKSAAQLGEDGQGQDCLQARSLVRSTEAVVDATVQVLDLPARHIAPDFAWSRDARYLFMVDVQGTLRKISVPDLSESALVTLEEQVNALALCSTGILLALPDRQEVWVIDEDALEVTRRIAVGPIAQLASSPELPVAFVTRGSDSSEITVVDTEGGSVSRVVSAAALARDARDRIDRHPDAKALISGFAHLRVSGDGRFLFAISGHSLHRFRIVRDTLEYEAVSAPLVAGRLFLSPDSQYVGVHARPGEAVGHPVDRASGYFVYRIDDFSRPLVGLPRVNYGGLSFDPAAGLLYVGIGGGVGTYDTTGAPLKEYRLPPVGGRRGLPHTLLTHPAGHQLLAHSDDILTWFTFPGREDHSPQTHRPVATNQSVMGDAREVGGVRLTPLQVGQQPEKGRTQRSILAVFSPDGAYIYVLERDGLVRRISTQDLVEQQQLELPGDCTALQWSGVGLLVLSGQAQELLVLDPATLDVIRRIPVSKATDVVAGRDAHDAFLSRNHGLVHVNLGTGVTASEPVRLEDDPRCRIHPDARDRLRNRATSRLQTRERLNMRISNDGSTGIFLADDALVRTVIRPDRWIRHEVGPPIAGPGFALTDDGYVAARVNEDRQRAAGYGGASFHGLCIYAAGDLASSVVAVPGATCPTAPNPVLRCILCAARSLHTLVQVSPSGIVERMIHVFSDRDGDYLRNLHLHPDGRHLLIVGDYQVLLAEWPEELVLQDAITTPLAKSVERVLSSEGTGADNVTAYRLDVDTETLIPEVAWSSDGAFAFLLQRDGHLLKLRLSDRTFVRQLDIGASCTSLARAEKGLLVALDEQQELWVIDPTTLELRQRILAPQPLRIRAAASSNVAYATGPYLRGKLHEHRCLSILDLNEGRIVDQMTTDRFVREFPDIPRKERSRDLSFASCDLTSDGKYFLLAAQSCVSRFRVEEAGMRFEAAGPWLQQDWHNRFEVSSDGQMIGVQVSRTENPGLGDYQGLGFSWLFFRLSALDKPLAALSERYPALAFDPRSSGIYVADSNLVSWINLDGDKRQDVKVGPDRGGGIDYIIPHPAGHGFFAGSRKCSYWVVWR